MSEEKDKKKKNNTESYYAGVIDPFEEDEDKELAKAEWEVEEVFWFLT